MSINRKTQSKNRKTFDLIAPIVSYLYGYSLIAVAVIVNILTVNLKLKKDEATNSVLLILPKGCGKNTLLTLMLQQSNPNWFPELPERIFESQILKMPDTDFDHKVWVLEDLITSFRGTSGKQREQLMAFFTSFLSRGTYARDQRRVEGRIVCIFGYAKENYSKYSKRMFETTFTDRFMEIELDFDKNIKRQILRARQGNSAKSIPTIKLPFKTQLVNVTIPATFTNEIIDLSMELDDKDRMSFARTQTYINNFLKSNADINGRTTVCAEDLMLLKLVFPIFLGTSIKKVDTLIRMYILWKAIKGKSVTGRQIKNEIMKATNCSESTIQKSLSELRKNNVVCFQKKSLYKGYDYEYWI